MSELRCTVVKYQCLVSRKPPNRNLSLVDPKQFEWIPESGQQFWFHNAALTKPLTLRMYGCDPWRCQNVWFRDVSSCDEEVPRENHYTAYATVLAGIELLRPHEHFFFLRPNATTSHPVYVKDENKTVRFRVIEKKNRKYLLGVVVPGRRFDIDQQNGW